LAPRFQLFGQLRAFFRAADAREASVKATPLFRRFVLTVISLLAKTNGTGCQHVFAQPRDLRFL